MSKAQELQEVQDRLMTLAGYSYSTGATWNWLVDLIGRHPNADEKLDGVAAVRVRRRRRNGLTFPEIDLLLHDGSVRDCSWRACVNGRDSQDVLVRRAMRWEVREQVVAARASFARPMRCCRCEGVIFGDDYHVDHVGRPFVAIAMEFLADLHSVGTLVRVTSLPQGGYRMADDDVALTWRAFHRARASLMPSHRVCNMRAGAA